MSCITLPAQKPRTILEVATPEIRVMKPELVRDRWHRYNLGDEPVFPSITTSIGKMDKPGLIYWAAGSVAQFVVEQRDRLVPKDGQAVSPEVASEVFQILGDVDRLKKVPMEKRDDAADFGTKFHIIAEAFASGRPVRMDAFDAQMRPYCENFFKLLQLVKPDLRFIEFPAFNRCDDFGKNPRLSAFSGLRYAGTGDTLGIMDVGDGLGHVWTYCDWKTSKSCYEPREGKAVIYPLEHWMQGTAVARCQFMYDTDRHETIEMPKVKRILVGHVTECSAKFWSWPVIDEPFYAFMGLRWVYELEKLKDVNPRMVASS